jgi:hypothetical protein
MRYLHHPAWIQSLGQLIMIEVVQEHVHGLLSEIIMDQVAVIVGVTHAR